MPAVMPYPWRIALFAGGNNIYTGEYQNSPGVTYFTGE
jgi:hypothetical protein